MFMLLNAIHKKVNKTCTACGICLRVARGRHGKASARDQQLPERLVDSAKSARGLKGFFSIVRFGDVLSSSVFFLCFPARNTPVTVSVFVSVSVSLSVCLSLSLSLSLQKREGEGERETDREIHLVSRHDYLEATYINRETDTQR